MNTAMNVVLNSFEALSTEEKAFIYAAMKIKAEKDEKERKKLESKSRKRR